MRFAFILAVLSTALPSCATELRDTFHETLTLHPLPDGKLSVLFEFTTHFSLHKGEGTTSQSHHHLTPPSLLLPLEKNRVSELTVSFASGQWHPEQHGEAGPLSYEAGGGGSEVRGWLHTPDWAHSDNSSRQAPDTDGDDMWDAVTKAFGGMFCAGVSAEHNGETVRTFGELFPPARVDDNITHYYVSTPHLHLCTENLTPFLGLLPSKGLAGLSSLLAQPGVVLSWGFKTEGIEVVMPTETEPGRWTGWWEGVVDLVPQYGGKRSFSISSLFGKPVPRQFRGADSSKIRVIAPMGGFSVDPPPTGLSAEWKDGVRRDIAEWDLADTQVSEHDLNFWWYGEDTFEYPQSIKAPYITISRVAADRYASDGTFVVELSNAANVDREAVYSEVWPWWVKGWLSEMTVGIKGQEEQQDDLITSIDFNQSTPPTPSTTTLHLGLILPARSTVVLRIPFTKLTLKYTDHRPDAERGREIPASILTLLDIEGEALTRQELEQGIVHWTVNPKRTDRRRVYGPKLLLDVPVPDFSMPYNVIIMSSTVLAICFGSIQGRLVRRWGWVKKGPSTKDDAKAKTE